MVEEKRNRIEGEEKKGRGEGGKRGGKRGEKRLERNVSDRNYDKGQIK